MMPESNLNGILSPGDGNQEKGTQNYHQNPRASFFHGKSPLYGY
jgi:hypothetical protein